MFHFCLSIRNKCLLFRMGCMYLTHLSLVLLISHCVTVNHAQVWEESELYFTITASPFALIHLLKYRKWCCSTTKNLIRYITAFSAFPDNWSNTVLLYENIVLFTCSSFWKTSATAFQNIFMLKFALEFCRSLKKCTYAAICAPLSLDSIW